MKRTTIMATEETVQRLKRLARDRGVSFAQVAREALEEKAAGYRPRPSSLGIGSSAGRDLAPRTDDRTPPRSWR